ncbi:MAG: helix-turn-helix transcriptional regulator, partial [Dehalococcoidia bacterium]
IQIMRRRRIVTARLLAEELEVSERTVYRDISDLVSSGVPIEGEAGVGYLLRPGFDLPPLMFTAAEVEALILGMRVVGSWGDAGLAKAATAALERVEAALPEKLRSRFDDTHLYAPGFHVRPEVLEHLGGLRSAVDGRRKVFFRYRDTGGVETERVVRPLGLFFWGYGWSLVGWCELRQGFRQFRLDRVLTQKILDDTFEEEDGKRLEDFYAEIEQKKQEAAATVAASMSDADRV